MSRTRILAISGLLAGTAILLQVMPGMLGQTFIFVTLFSGFPIFIISTMNPALGFAAYCSTGIAAALVSMPCGILFLFTNGIIGLSLGILSKSVESEAAMSAFTAALTAAMLFLLNYVFGICVFDYSIIKHPIAQVISLFCFLFPFCFAYLKAAIYINAYFSKSIYLGR